MKIKNIIIAIVVGVLILYLIFGVLKVKRETANWIAIAVVVILLLASYIIKKRSTFTNSNSSDKIENNKNAANHD